MTSELENCMYTMIAVFNRYSGRSGDKFKLNKDELDAILQEQLPAFYKTTCGKGDLKKLMNSLDYDKDGEVSFKEFSMLVTGLTMACHEFFITK